MGKHVLILIVGLVIVSCIKVTAQTNKIKQDAIEDTSIGIKPTIKIENVSAPGHCNNQELSFFAPWADHYEIAKRRSDTGWIMDRKPQNTWFSQTLQSGITGMIYKGLDEQGAYQFIVKAFKGNRYRGSDTITLKPCVAQK